MHHVAPPGRHCQKSANDYHLVQDVDGGTPGRQSWRIRERAPSTFRNIDDGAPGGAMVNSGVPTINAQKMSMTGPLGGDAGESRSAYHQH
jgi:hypothetical protein